MGTPARGPGIPRDLPVVAERPQPGGASPGDHWRAVVLPVLLPPLGRELERSRRAPRRLAGSFSGASRDRTGDLLRAKQIGLSTRVSWCRVTPCKCGISVGHGRTRKDGARQTGAPWCPLGVRDLGRREEGSPRLARPRQLEDAAAAKADLASAIAVCASSRGISSNSSITWPYVLRVSRASWPSWRAT